VGGTDPVGGTEPVGGATGAESILFARLAESAIGLR
jgi:hypothetical protein